MSNHITASWIFVGWRRVFVFFTLSSNFHAAGCCGTGLVLYGIWLNQMARWRVELFLVRFFGNFSDNSEPDDFTSSIPNGLFCYWSYRSVSRANSALWRVEAAGYWFALRPGSALGRVELAEAAGSGFWFSWFLIQLSYTSSSVWKTICLDNKTDLDCFIFVYVVLKFDLLA